MPESSAIDVHPVAAAATRALASAFSANVAPVSGGSSTLVGYPLEVVRHEQQRELAQLVGVARGDDEPHGVPASIAVSCATRSSLIPVRASSSRSSRWVLASGVPSAVACTSSSPPSPVMTTLASTSAEESSG